jgi:hypothetical protein
LFTHRGSKYIKRRGTQYYVLLTISTEACPAPQNSSCVT